VFYLFPFVCFIATASCAIVPNRSGPELPKSGLETQHLALNRLYFVLTLPSITIHPGAVKIKATSPEGRENPKKGDRDRREQCATFST
jgi:hypothetical protein